MTVLEQLRPLINCVVWIVFCHITGDYIFSPKVIDLPTSKYSIFVRGICYCLPYLICFGIRWQLGFIFVVEMLVDYYGRYEDRLNMFWNQYIKLVAALVYIIPIYTGVRANLGPVTMWLM